MGIPNVLHGTVIKATPDRIQLRWRGQILEAVNSPTRSYLPPPEAPIAFFIRPEYVRLIRKDRGPADPHHHMNLMSGLVVADEDFGTTWTAAHPPRRARPARSGRLRSRGRGAPPRVRDPRDRARPPLGVLDPPRVDPRAAVVTVAARAARRAPAPPGRLHAAGARPRRAVRRGAGRDRSQRQRQVHAAARAGAAGAPRRRHRAAGRPPGRRARRAGRAAPDGHGVPGAAPRRHDRRRQRRASACASAACPVSSGPARVGDGWSGSASARSARGRRGRCRAARPSEWRWPGRWCWSPSVLLLDEPFASLDQPTRTALIADLGTVLRQDRVTTVLVTHRSRRGPGAGRSRGRAARRPPGPDRRDGARVPGAGHRGGRALRRRGDDRERTGGRAAGGRHARGGRQPHAGGGGGGRDRRPGAAGHPSGGRDACRAARGRRRLERPQRAGGLDRTRSRPPTRVSGSWWSAGFPWWRPSPCARVDELRLVEGMAIAAMFKASAPHLIPGATALDTPAGPEL